MSDSITDQIVALAERFDGSEIAIAHYPDGWWARLNSYDLVSDYDGNPIKGHGITPTEALADLTERIANGVTPEQWQAHVAEVWKR